MNKQYIYKLEIDNNPDYKIMDIGTLAIEEEDKDFDGGLVYKRKYDIGYYITESQTRDKITILLKSYEDLGEVISCRLDFKLMYINQYATKLTCETILVTSDEDRYLHKATKIKKIGDLFRYILDGYDW